MEQITIYIKDNIDNYRAYRDIKNTEHIYLLENDIAEKLDNFENVKVYRLVSNGKFENLPSFRLDKEYLFPIPVNRLDSGLTVNHHFVIF